MYLYDQIISKHSSLHCVLYFFIYNYITISCIYLFPTPNSRFVFRAGVSLNFHSFIVAVDCILMDVCEENI